MQDPLEKKKRSLLNKLCCVPECTQTKRCNKELRLYSFPNREWEKERKKIWISRVRREPGWIPTKRTRICSAHFIDGIKSQDPRKENYHPSIFPWKKEKESALKRRKRLADRIKRRMESSSTNKDAETNGVVLPIEPNVSKKRMKKSHGISVQTEMRTDIYNHEEFQNVSTLCCWLDLSRNEASTQTFIPAFKNWISPYQNCVSNLNSSKGACNFRQKCQKSIQTHKAYVRESRQGNEYFQFLPVSGTSILNKQKDKSFKDIKNVDEIKFASNVDLRKCKLPEMGYKQMSNELQIDEYLVKKEINEELVIKEELQEDLLIENYIPNSSNIPNMRNEEKEDEYFLSDDSIETGKLEVDVNTEINEELVIKEKLGEDVLFQNQIPNSLQIPNTRNGKNEDEYILPDDLTEPDFQSTHPDIDPSDGANSIDAYKRPYKCDVCWKTFKQIFEMKRHYQFHTGKLHICKICHRSFTGLSYLKVHYRIHKGDKPFCCSVCQKKFVSSSHLKHHELVHSDAKPYSCGICQKKFAASRYVRRHEAIHSATKPYSCEICQRSFTYKCNMKVHKCIVPAIKTHE